MTELLTAAQMRAIEQAAIVSGEVTGLELMERAGRGVVEAVFEEWPELAAVDGGAAPKPPGYLGEKETFRAVVLCGPGNNGGDGFVVARLLKELGWEVEVFLYGDADKLPADARVNYERWGEMGGVRKLNFPFVSEDDEQSIYHSLWIGHKGERRLCIDALFGTGLSRAIDGLRPISMLFDHIYGLDLNEGLSVVAVDIPSGYSADTGEILGGDTIFPIDADLTVTFHSAKLGHEISPLSMAVGKLVVKEIGL